VSQVNGVGKTGNEPLPYQRTAKTPNLAFLDSSDDIRGGMGIEGLMELARFVEAGGLLITEGSTATIFPAYGLTSGVTVEEPENLTARGSILRGIIADRLSPIAYGYEGNQLPVYFNQAPVLSAGGGFGGGFGGFFGGARGPWQNTTPMATRPSLSPWEPVERPAGRRGPPGAGAGDEEAAQMRQMARAFGIAVDESRPRVVLQFPGSADQMLLSGVLDGGEALRNRAQVVDAKLGQGHIVMFGIRPFWRWQTQGTFFLGFNAILNWNDLDAGQTDR